MKKIIYRVRIKDCSNPLMYWYYDKLGQEFECILRENTSFFWPAKQLFTTVTPIGMAQFAGQQPQVGNILPHDVEVISSTEREINPNYN
jgi:hypothetical protein